MQFLNYYLKQCNFQGKQPDQLFQRQLQEEQQCIRINVSQLPIFQTLNKMNIKNLILEKILMQDQIIQLLPLGLIKLSIDHCPLSLNPQLLSNFINKISRINHLEITNSQVSDNFIIQLTNTQFENLEVFILEQAQLSIKGSKGLVNFLLQKRSNKINVSLNKIQVSQGQQQFIWENINQNPTVFQDFILNGKSMIKIESLNCEDKPQSSQNIPIPMKPEIQVPQRVENDLTQIKSKINNLLSFYQTEFSVKIQIYQKEYNQFLQLQQQLPNIFSTNQNLQQAFRQNLDDCIQQITINNTIAMSEEQISMYNQKLERLQKIRDDQLLKIRKLQSKFVNEDIIEIQKRIEKIQLRNKPLNCQ